MQLNGARANDLRVSLMGDLSRKSIATQGKKGNTYGIEQLRPKDRMIGNKVRSRWKENVRFPVIDYPFKWNTNNEV